MNVYTPDASKIVHMTSVDLVTRHIGDPIHVVQYDNSMPIVKVELYYDGQIYRLPEGMEANIRFGKPDGTFVYNPALGSNADRSALYFEITYQMTIIPKEYRPVIEFSNGHTIGSTSSFDITVDKNPVTNDMIESTIEFKFI